MLRRQPHYPSQYLWFVLLSSLDVFFTWIVLYFGGGEANPFANHFLSLNPRYLIFYKFGLVIFVILICELLGDRHKRAGLNLVHAACLITCVPVLLAITQLAAHR
jgi:hypothetical protein